MEGALSCNHDAFYFDDGNIVLGCRNSIGGTTYFRVHKGYLASQSTVVSDMLTLPTGEGNHETHDGAPLVNFPESVTAEAMATFLTFFYEPSHKLLAQDDTDIAYKLFDVLVLSDLFMVDKLKRSIIDRIKQDWAIPTVEEWQRRYANINADRRWFYHFYEPASTIRVARRFDETLLTPLQFFELSFRDHLLPYRPVPPLSRNLPDTPDERPSPGARWELISLQDKYRAGYGYHLFLSEFEVQTDRILYPEDEWPANTPCLEDGHDGIQYCQMGLQQRLEDMTLYLLRGRHPLRVILEAKLGPTRDHMQRSGEFITIHEECAVEWNRKIDKMLVDLFDKIPQFYAERE